MGARRDGRRAGFLRHRGAGRALGPGENHHELDRVRGVHRDGGRRLPRRAARGQAGAPPGLRPHAPDLRRGHGRFSARRVGRCPARLPFPHRTGPRRGAARRVHAGQRVRAAEGARADGGLARGVLGGGLDPGGGHRHVRRRRGRKRLALGACARRRACALRTVRAHAAAGIGPLPGVARPRRGSRGSGPQLRGASPARTTYRRTHRHHHRSRCKFQPSHLGPRTARPHRRVLDRLVLRFPRLLRRVHLDPFPACGPRLQPRALLQLHADHHAGPAARVRPGRLAH